MNTSIVLGNIYGVVFTVVGLGLLVRPGHFRTLVRDMVSSPGLLFLGGVLALIVGSLVVTLHNVWSGGWVVIITVFGWMGLLKGITLTLFPQAMMGMTTAMVAKPMLMRAWGVIALILGLVMLYFSVLGG
jgi:uncharacterized protein YjeT (DUF2065 family)